MSWVTDVVLFYNLSESFVDFNKEGETFNPSNIRHMGISPCLTNINAWLHQNKGVELVNLNEHASGRERKSMQAYVWGGAFNYLNITDFLRHVKAQEWREPESVQVMVKDEQEPKFTLYHLSDID